MNNSDNILENKLSEEKLEIVNGGIRILPKLGGNTAHEDSPGKPVKETVTVCPKCHGYRAMTLSVTGNELTCSCGHTWSVFI